LKRGRIFWEIGGLILLSFTVVFAGGALIVNKRLNTEQAAQLRTFDKNLTDAKKQVETLRGDNLKLEEQIQPRKLSLDDRLAISHALAGFAGTPITVAWVDPESHAFAEQIIDALKAAHLKVRYPDASRLITAPTGKIYSYTYTIPIETGVRINCPPGQKKFGVAIRDALANKVLGLVLVEREGPLPTIGLAPYTGQPEPGVMISVLTKPFAQADAVAQHKK
jgi:hypothetical protein